VLLDSDITHRVTNPVVEGRVRYSLAVKMLMRDWEEAKYGEDMLRRVGSAAKGREGGE